MKTDNVYHCPTCEQKMKTFEKSRMFERDIVEQLRMNSNYFQHESCIYCVKKHVAKAMVLIDEIMTYEGAGTNDGKAKIDVYKNHIMAIGNLSQAVRESYDYTALNKALKDAERAYRYYLTIPDFGLILDLLQKQQKALQKNEIT